MKPIKANQVGARKKRGDAEAQRMSIIDSCKMKAGFLVGRIRRRRRNPPSLRNFSKGRTQ